MAQQTLRRATTSARSSTSTTATPSASATKRSTTMARLSPAFWYVLVRGAILVLSAVVPLSALWLLVRHGHALIPALPSNFGGWLQLLRAYDVAGTVSATTDHPWLSALEVWAVVELLFYLHYRITLRRLQNHRPLHASAANFHSAAHRRRTFERIILTLEDGQLKSFIESWFFGARLADIGRENLAEFMAWVFYLEDHAALVQKAKEAESTNVSVLGEHCGRRTGTTTLDPATAAAYLQEIEKLTDECETLMHVQFAPGYNRNVRCMRLNLDPLEPRHRPLVYYAAVQSLHYAFALYMRFVLGFRKYHSQTSHRASLLAARRRSALSNSANVSYWYRGPASSRGSSDTRPPLVFIHGIGVGLFGYATMISKLASMTGDRGVFAVEQPHVSTLLFPLYAHIAENVPSMQDMLDAIESMLRTHRSSYGKQHKRAVFAGHSLGTAVVSWVVRHRPQLVDRVLFIDPICFMLHLPDLAYNFVYRVPQSTVEWLLWWFASRELYISWTLGRCFVWYQNVLFIEDIPATMPVDVVLGGKDSIVPGNAIRNYLLRRGRAIESRPECGFHDMRQTEGGERNNMLRLHYFPHRNHAEFLFAPEMERRVVELMVNGGEWTRHELGEDVQGQAKPQHTTPMSSSTAYPTPKSSSTAYSSPPTGSLLSSPSTRSRSRSPLVRVQRRAAEYATMTEIHLTPCPPVRRLRPSRSMSSVRSASDEYDKNDDE